MYRVLLALDADEDRAEQAATAVAKLPCSDEAVEVVILNVFEKFEVTEDVTVRSDQFYDAEEFPESVDLAATQLTEADVSVTKRREHGDPAETIVEVANELEADCIAMSGRQRSPTGKVIFGSTTQSVLLSAARPVHVVIED